MKKGMSERQHRGLGTNRGGGVGVKGRREGVLPPVNIMPTGDWSWERKRERLREGMKERLTNKEGVLKKEREED